MNYEADITIDSEALDVEWLRQPRLTYQYGKLQAEIELKLGKAKEDLDLIKADLDKQIRLNPDEFEVVKITEVAVTNTIIAHPDYQNQNGIVLDLIYELNVIKAAKAGIETKKTALENLVKLNGQNYFAGPTVPRDLTKEWEQKENQRESNRMVRMKRTKE
jgi:hypothetical protein